MCAGGRRRRRALLGEGSGGGRITERAGGEEQLCVCVCVCRGEGRVAEAHGGRPTGAKTKISAPVTRPADGVCCFIVIFSRTPVVGTAVQKFKIIAKIRYSEFENTRIDLVK